MIKCHDMDWHPAVKGLVRYGDFECNKDGIVSIRGLFCSDFGAQDLQYLKVMDTPHIALVSVRLDAKYFM